VFDTPSVPPTRVSAPAPPPLRVLRTIVTNSSDVFPPVVSTPDPPAPDPLTARWFSPMVVFSTKRLAALMIPAPPVLAAPTDAEF
jgi:hypothetical protein